MGGCVEGEGYSGDERENIGHLADLFARMVGYIVSYLVT